MSLARSKRWLVPLALFSLITLFYLSFDLSSPPRFRLVEQYTGTTDNSTVLIVSAFFPLKKSKHSPEEYKHWLNNFLLLETPVYLFVPKEVEAILPDPLPQHLTVNTSLSSPFDIPPLHGLEEAYDKQWNKDKEKKRHNSELYAIWNAKPWLLQQASQNTGRKYDNYFWSDAGGFRSTHYYRRWPSPSRIPSTLKNNNALFIPIFSPPSPSNKGWKEGDGPIEEDISEGSFFGGPASAVRWYSNAFYAYHKYYLALDYFIGKDQSIINSLFLLYPDRFYGIWYNDPYSPAYEHAGKLNIWKAQWWRKLAQDHWSRFSSTRALGKCGAEWYYYQFFLANDEERAKMQDEWLVNTPEDGWGKWLKDGTDKGDKCRLGSLISVESLLKRKEVFGDGWTVPQKFVKLETLQP